MVEEIKSVCPRSINGIVLKLFGLLPPSIRCQRAEFSPRGSCLPRGDKARLILGPPQGNKTAGGMTDVPLHGNVSKGER